MMDLEEMLRELSEKYRNSKSVEVYEEQLEWWFKLIDDLREENKNLKSDLAFERTMLDNVRAEYKSLQNVNKKLNIKVASLEWEIKWLNYTIDKLKEENQTLELWLDNKEKLNEEYRKQIDKLRTDNIYEEWLYD
jgi:chromosome segregation ATPase